MTSNDPVTPGGLSDASGGPASRPAPPDPRRAAVPGASAPSAPALVRLAERLDRTALASLRAAVDALAGAPTAVVRGASPGVFCLGVAFDQVGAIDAAERDAGLADFEAAALALATSSTRTVAAVEGDALGGGLGVAAACDVVVAVEDARFGLPEPIFGLIPGLVLPLIRARIGPAALRRLALGGGTIDAREAWRLGLVDEVAVPAELETRVATWIRRLARAEPAATARLKGWLAEMDDLPGEVARGRTHLAELLGSDVVARRVERYQQGLAPWGDDDGTT